MSTLSNLHAPSLNAHAMLLASVGELRYSVLNLQGGAQQNTAYSVFDVSVILSNDGLTHWADVVALVFKYSAACNALTRQTPCSMLHAAKPCKMQRTCDSCLATVDCAGTLHFCAKRRRKSGCTTRSRRHGLR